MGRLMTQTVVLRTRSTTPSYDQLGNPIPGPDADVSSPAWYEPLGSSEVADAASQQRFGYWVYLPIGTDVDGADAVVIDGLEFEVVGPPQTQPGGFIVEGFLRVMVERVTG